MKKYVGIFVLFLALMTFVPAIALVGQGGGNPPLSGSSKTQTLRQSSSKTPGSSSKGASSKGVASSKQEETTPASVLTYKLLDKTSDKVIDISAADYIKGVVAAEMPADFHEEALKAQAVAAHTYALRTIDKQLKNPSTELKGAYFSTDPGEFQAYMSKEQAKAFYGSKFDAYWEKISKAVDSVIDKVAVVNDQPIAAAFHSISGGKTEGAKNVWGSDVSYLQPVDSPGDKLSPDYEADAVFSSKEVSNKLTSQNKTLTLDPDKTKWFTGIKTTDSGTVSQITVGNSTLTGSQLRSLLGLRSACFTVAYNKEKDSFTFHTKGYGHGVGMSQYGADYLARQGQTYEQILKHYYTGVELVSINDLK